MGILLVGYWRVRRDADNIFRYFFTSNSGVDGCAKKKEPGYEQFEWLRIQLQIMRDRGMSAILIGHVPPARVNSKESWDETCWQKYTLWEKQYRDVIVASIFGHMNIDHFMLQDFHHIKKGAKKGLMATSDIQATIEEQENGLLTDGEVTVASASDYLVDLRSRWSKLPSPQKKNKKKQQSIGAYIDEDEDQEIPSIWQKTLSLFKKPSKKPNGGSKKTFLDKIGGRYAERYSVSLVSPSVVPNYFPTIRIFEYNITGLEHLAVSPLSDQETFSNSLIQKLATEHETTPDDHEFLDDGSYSRTISSILKRKHKHSSKTSFKKNKKYKFKVPKGPSKSSPPGPAYSPQPLTLTSYTQYFANLTHINNDFVESLTPPPSHSRSQSPNNNTPQTLFGLAISPDGTIEQSGWKEGKHGKHQGKRPHVKPRPKKFRFEVEYDTKTDKRYALEDLTVRSFVDLARRIGEGDGKGKGKASLYRDGEGEEEVEEGEEEEEEVEETKVKGGKKGGKKKKKKGKKGKGKGGSKNKTWLTFVNRAFVGTLDEKELGLFSGDFDVEGEDKEESVEIDVEVDQDEEIMEL